VNIVWTRPALIELEMIGDHIARENPEAAKHTVSRIIEAVATLSRHPHLGRPGRVADTRELVVTTTPFIVPYRVREDRIEVLTVFHGARMWPEGFK
jgi:toxin ParE1/3/4